MFRNDYLLIVKEHSVLIYGICMRNDATTHTILPDHEGLIAAMTDHATTSSFGKRLFELRKAKGWSQPELAKHVGITDAIIGRYERGNTTPSVDIAKRLADALGVTLDYLVSDDPSPNILHDKASYERCKALAALPESDKQHAHFLIDMIIRDSRARLTYG